MAFASNGGYVNLPNGVFSPSIFSQKALKAFRKTSVVEDITNTDYFGEIANYGDTVHVISEPDVSVAAYTRGLAPTTQALTDAEITMTVDHANYFQFAIDDIEKKQAHLNWESLASNRAAYKIKDAFDNEVLTYISAQPSGSAKIGTATVSIQVADGATPSSSVFTPLGILNRAKRILDLANVPSDNRWFVGDPVFYEQLGSENSKLLQAYITGDSASPMRNGKVTEGLVRGFSLYESNNLPAGGTGPDSTHGSTNYGVLLAGHMSSTSTVSQIAKVETFRSPTTFADVVRGLHMYGRKVIRPESLVAIFYSVG
jgi:hypothetical protein